MGDTVGGVGDLFFLLIDLHLNGRLPVCLYGIWSDWPLVNCNDHLDLICHKPMTALHVSQFTQRRERDIDRKGEVGGWGSVRQKLRDAF